MIETADIVIIGGGVHGASLAHHLAKRKASRVALLEKNWLAAGPTSKSGAMIRPLFVDDIYNDLVMASTDMFERWAEEVGGDAGFVQNGFLRITESLEKADLGADLSRMTKRGLPFELLGLDAMRLLVSSATFKGTEKGLFFPKGGFADPLLTTLTLAASAERRGAHIYEGISVTGIEIKKGRVEAVQTDRGRIVTPCIVNCAGAWSDRIAAMAGLSIPVQVHRVPTGIFRRPEIMPEEGPILSDGVNRVYLRAFGNGLFRASHFGWKPEAADPERWNELIDQGQLSTIRDALNERYAPMRRSPAYGGFAALYDMTPDGHPIVGKMPEIEGFWCNCGWSGNGFAPAPAVGGALSQLMLDGKSDIDISFFRWPRGAEVEARAECKWIHR